MWDRRNQRESSPSFSLWRYTQLVRSHTGSTRRDPGVHTPTIVWAQTARCRPPSSHVLCNMLVFGLLTWPCIGGFHLRPESCSTWREGPVRYLRRPPVNSVLGTVFYLLFALPLTRAATPPSISRHQIWNRCFPDPVCCSFDKSVLCSVEASAVSCCFPHFILLSVLFRAFLKTFFFYIS